MATAVYATAPVGATPGSFSVSPSGAATYAIPIAIPPGTNKTQPNLSLTYSNQARNGLLGVGWSLGGLSVIHRCGATIAIDGFKGGVNYDGNDRFCLDGERLIYIGNNEYRTSHESWQRIIASDATTNPASFMVYERDGTIRYYGYYGSTNDARIFASSPNTSIVRVWALNTVQDRNGNYLTISYTQNSAVSEYYPSSIAYTGNSNAGVAPYNFVYFDYQTRSDVISYYQAGSLIQTSHRLSGIRTCTDASCTVGVNGSLARQYILSYDNNGAVGRSRLISVQECGTDGVCLPATTLTWTPAPASPLGAAVNTGIAANAYRGVIQTADINGDGRGDLVWLDASTYYFYTALARSGTPGFAPSTNSSLYAGYTNFVPGIFSVGDINGNGVSDLSRGAGPIFGRPADVLYAGTSSAGLTPPWSLTYFPSVQYPGPAPLADIDGDGRADLIFLNGSAGAGVSSTFNYALSIGNSFGSVATSTAGTIMSIVPADFNGDGRADMLCIQQSGALSYFSYALSTGTSLGQCMDTGLWGTCTAGPWPVDINGDGDGDLVCQGGYVYYAFSKGKGFTTAVNSNVTPSLANSSSITLADINGDGLPDVVWMGNDGYIHYALANGNGFNAAVNTYQTASISSGPWAVDFNGDGKQDLVWIYNGTIYYSQAQGEPTDLLQSVTDGLGVQTTVSYQPLTNSTVYAKDNISVYPYQDVQNATYVVASYTQSNGMNSTNTTNVTYGGLKKHLTANANLGFRWTQVVDPPGPGQTQGLIHITYFNQTLDGTEGTVHESQTFANGVLVKDVVNTWTPASSPVCSTCVIAKLTGSTETTREINNSLVTTVTTANIYDDYENPTSVIVTYAVGGENDGWQQTATNTYYNDPVNWFFQLTQSQVTANAPGQMAQTRTSSFTYDSLGRLYTETIEPNDTAGHLKLVTTYGYDSFGNRTNKQLSGPDINSRNEYTRQYDARGQFIAWQTNALNHKTIYNSYDFRNGAPTQLTDPNGLITKWRYNDGFARVTLETRPDNTTTSYTYQGCDSSCPALATTMFATATSGAGTTWVYRDMFGRGVRKLVQGFGGAWVYRDTAYDNLGRVASVSNPYYSGATVYFTSYGYDILNRVTTITEPGAAGTCNGPGRTTVSQYNGLSTTVTNPKCQAKTTVKNSQGQVASVTDAAGTVSYQYDPFGNLIQVTGVDNAIAAMTYDIRGRKRTMSDPDMGAWSYNYDALGELVSQIDAKNQTISMTYDSLERLKTRTTPEGMSTWTYDTAALGATGRLAVGKLASVSNSNATETYIYDNLAQVSTDTVSIGGVNYTVGYTYDAYSRVDILTYPETGFAVKYYYDDPNSGMLKEIKNTATLASFWKINPNGVDALNHIVNETYGNGLITQRQYDLGTGDLDYIKTGTSNNATSAQYLSYNFDVLHNLDSRADAIQNFTETFNYDEDGLGLNRLTSVTGPVNKTYRYAANGNLTYKSDVGTYTYPTNGIQPHAVASVAGAINTSYLYDANGNMTSGNARTITYYSFNKPKTITNSNGTATLTYDANFNRLIKANAYNTTIYIGKFYERVTSGTTVSQKHYLYAGNRLVSIYSQYSTGTTSTKYVHTDHLGSVNALTNETGSVLQWLSYDAHGKRRYPNGTDAAGTMSISALNPRGFTGEEHDDEVGLLNLNAREYDYVIGRFISSDSMIAGTLNSQSYNRYSYVNNNPLSYTDPSGRGNIVSNFFDSALSWAARVYFNYGTAIAAVAIGGGIYNGMVGAGVDPVYAGATAGATVGGITGGNLKSAAYGALAGASFAEVGELAAENGWGAPGCAKCVAAHALVGGTLSQITYGDFRSGFLSAGVAEWAAPVADWFPNPAAKTIAAGLIGGGGARLGGGNFNNGFVTAAFGYLFNDSGDHKHLASGFDKDFLSNLQDKNPVEYRLLMNYSDLIDMSYYSNDFRYFELNYRNFDAYSRAGASLMLNMSASDFLASVYAPGSSSILGQVYDAFGNAHGALDLMRITNEAFTIQLYGPQVINESLFRQMFQTGYDPSLNSLVH